MTAWRFMEIGLLALPWAWIAVAVLILAWPARRARRPWAAKAFAIVLAAYGVSDFFVTARGRPPVWLIVWKAACILTLAAILADSFGRGALRRRRQ